MPPTNRVGQFFDQSRVPTAEHAASYHAAAPSPRLSGSRLSRTNRLQGVLSVEAYDFDDDSFLERGRGQVLAAASGAALVTGGLSCLTWSLAITAGVLPAPDPVVVLAAIGATSLAAGSFVGRRWTSSTVTNPDRAFRSL